MRKAIVTGHSRGIGAELARQLERDGWEVLGIARATGAAIDLGDLESLTGWLDSGELGRFLAGATSILLINNAGLLGPAAVTGQLDPRQAAHAVAVNVTAPLILTDAVLAARPTGATVRIAHISSGAGRRPVPGWSVYCATKAAIDMHAQTVAAEGHDGVRVASIAPGIVDTGMQGEIRASEGFPLREQFVGYERDGQLVPAAEAAAKVLAMIEAADFGHTVVADVRETG